MIPKKFVFGGISFEQTKFRNQNNNDQESKHYKNTY